MKGKKRKPPIKKLPPRPAMSASELAARGKSIRLKIAELVAQTPAVEGEGRSRRKAKSKKGAAAKPPATLVAIRSRKKLKRNQQARLAKLSKPDKKSPKPGSSVHAVGTGQTRKPGSHRSVK